MTIECLPVLAQRRTKMKTLVFEGAETAAHRRARRVSGYGQVDKYAPGQHPRGYERKNEMFLQRRHSETAEGNLGE